MAKAVVIGGSGHVGTYLIPRLIEAGYETVNVSRGAAAPYTPDPAWDRVEQVTLDRDAEEKSGAFGEKIAALDPDIVIDMICFSLESQKQLTSPLAGRVQHFIHVGTIWVHGHLTEVPATENAPRRPFGEYGTQKAAIEAHLLGAARRDGFPASIVHPGHIVGPGWAPLNPAGHFNTSVWADMAAGRELALPNFGLETVHHVHADDVAQIIMCCLRNWSAARGEAFNAVSPAAVSLRGYAEAMFAWFGHEPKLKFLPYDEWKANQEEGDAQATWEHIARSPAHSIEKGRRLIGYAPRYSSLAAVRESVGWLRDNGRI